MTSVEGTPAERFEVLLGGPSPDERDERLAEGAGELAEAGGRGSLLGNERFLLTLAAGLMTFGVCVILLGWYGAAHTTLSEEQTPYLISGGLLGLALTIIGAMCLLAHWITVLIREGRARDAVHRQDQAALLAAVQALAPQRNEQLEESANGSAGGVRAQRPLRRAPRSS
jgi:hypothetical protein